MEIAKVIVKKYWGIDAVLGEDTKGGSRKTWKLGDDLWLTCSEIIKVTSFKKECDVITAISNQSPMNTLKFPEIVPSISGNTFVNEDNFSWRITKNIPGTHPKPNDKRIYPALIKALNEFHYLLNNSKIQSPVLDSGTLDSFSAIDPFYFNHHNPLIVKCINWLVENLHELRRLKKSLTHGDFNPGNIFLSEKENIITVTGLIDFEFVRPDPLIMDYSQLLTMVVCHSGMTDAQSFADELVNLMENRFSRKQLEVAMMAYWLEMLLRWKSNEVVSAKFTYRVEQVWNFISAKN